MLFKTVITKNSKLSFSSKTTITFNENLEFSLTPQNSGNNNYIFHAHDFKGDFDIIKVYCTYGVNIPYDKETKTFVTGSNYSNHDYVFSVLIDIEYKKVAYKYVSYKLDFPLTRLRLLKLYEYYEEFFTLPEYEQMKFKYFVKKIREDAVEVCIENPHKIDIYDLNKSSTTKIHNFAHETPISSDIHLNLAFAFEPSDGRKVLNSQEDLYSSNSVNTLYEIMSNTNFADVVIYSSSGKEILSYRCVLAKYSKFFAKCFDESKELPVKLNLKDYDTETIKAALDFCYGKTDSIIGKEAKLYDFASKYSFIELKTACSHHFEKIVNPKNVCEIAEIAYSNNYENLKQKCLTIIAEHKDKIDPAELKKLPKDVLINVFFI